MTSVHDRNKASLAPFRSALAEGGADRVRAAIDVAFAPDARGVIAAPFDSARPDASVRLVLDILARMEATTGTKEEGAQEKAA